MINAASGGVVTKRKGRRRPQRVRVRSDHVLKTGLIQKVISVVIWLKTATCVMVAPSEACRRLPNWLGHSSSMIMKSFHISQKNNVTS